MIELALPFPPSLNRYYRHVGNKVLISENGRLYKDEVSQTIKFLRLKRFENKRVAVFITMRPPDHRRRDVDNYLKVLFDSITKSGLWDDDSQVDLLSIERGKNTPQGMMVVRIQEHG